MSKLFKLLIRLTAILILLTALLIVPVDRRNYITTDYYKSTMTRLDSLKEVLNVYPNGSFRVGWGMATITPDQPTRLTGPNWKPYHDILDSVHVRCLLFEFGSQKVVMLNYDLWIMHPNLSSYIQDLVSKEYPDINGFYFTANHSHTSIGGWGTGLLGHMIMGGNSREVLEFIGDQTLKALAVANIRVQAGLVGYGEMGTQGLVINRLDSTAYVDNVLRVLKFLGENGEKALYATFSAHSVYMNKDINTLSADYPGMFLQQATADSSVDFAAFSPGATGSHTPPGRKPFSVEKMARYGKRLANYQSEVEQKIQTDTLRIFKFARLPVIPPAPHFRISSNWRFRPQLFEQIMGKISPEITVLRLENTVMVALPIELSGEYYQQLKPVAASKGLNLMITTFNGDYMGYAIPKRYYYSLRRAEVRDMNWYGPQSGEYFSALVRELLLII